MERLWYRGTTQAGLRAEIRQRLRAAETDSADERRRPGVRRILDVSLPLIHRRLEEAVR